MKQSRFIELLNLYVDQELSPADSAELEAEIARNPERRHTYEQYCRMHRACVLLFENEQAPAPHFTKLVAAVREADEKVVAFPSAAPAGGAVARSPVWGRSVWAAGVVAAAACVALVVMRQAPSEVATSQPTAPQLVTVERAVVTGAREEPVTIPQVTPRQRTDYHTVLVAQPLLRGQGASAEPAVLSFASEEAPLEWMRRVQLSPLQRVSAEELVFDVRPVQTPESRTYRGRNPYAADAEPVAFQFQR